MSDRDNFYVYCKRGDGNQMVLGVSTGLPTCKPITLFYWEAASQEEAELRARQIEQTLHECLKELKRAWYHGGFVDGKKRKTPRFRDWNLDDYPGGFRGKP